MRKNLDILLSFEVAIVAGVSKPTLQNWVRFGHLSGPPIVGRHRRYSAQHTVEAILMAELVRLGLRGEVAGRAAVRMAEPVLNLYVDEWTDKDGIPEPPDSGPVTLRVHLETGMCALGRHASSEVPAGFLTVDIASIIEGALTRAMEIQKIRNE